MCRYKANLHMKVCKVYVDFTNLHIVFVFNVITSVRVPPLSLRGYEGWATCGQSTLTGSPLVSPDADFSFFP